MEGRTVRKFKDLVVGKDEGPQLSKVHAAFRSIATLPAGAVIEAWLLNILAQADPLGIPDGAFRETSARRRMAREIVHFMAEDPNVERTGTANARPDGDAPSGGGRKRHLSSPGRKPGDTD